MLSTAGLVGLGWAFCRVGHLPGVQLHVTKEDTYTDIGLILFPGTLKQSH